MYAMTGRALTGVPINNPGEIEMTKSNEKIFIVKKDGIYGQKQPKDGRRDSFEARLKESGYEIVGEVKSVPTMKTLEKYSDDGVCPTVQCGCRVEPDGHCKHGRPSWLLALGLI
jgi:hypothetical protein